MLILYNVFCAFQILYYLQGDNNRKEDNEENIVDKNIEENIVDENNDNLVESVSGNEDVNEQLSTNKNSIDDLHESSTLDGVSEFLIKYYAAPEDNDDAKTNEVEDDSDTNNIKVRKDVELEKDNDVWDENEIRKKIVEKLKNLVGQPVSVGDEPPKETENVKEKNENKAENVAGNTKTITTDAGDISIKFMGDDMNRVHTLRATKINDGKFILREVMHAEAPDIRRENIEFEYEKETGGSDALYETGMKLLNHTGKDSTSDQMEDEIKAYQIIKKAALAGHWKSKQMVSWAHIFGKYLPIDIKSAHSMFEELAAKGDKVGHMGLGFLYSTGLGTEANQAKAILHYTMAALGGNEWAQMAMGYRLWKGVGVTASCEDALLYYKMVATTVSEKVSLTSGRAVHRIKLHEEADNQNSASSINGDLIQYYQFMADKGDVSSAFGLGQLFYQGARGVMRDPRQALVYFQQAAEAGNANALGFLGKMYLEGAGGLEASNETAYKYFKKAADKSNPVGYSGLGLMYLEGKHVDQDYQLALRYFTLSAKSGWVEGQFQLGNMHYYGQGIAKSYEKASEYYKLAAQNGHVLAYYKLGQMQSSGLGMIRMCVTAVEFFKNVAERGSWSEMLNEAHKAYWEG